MEEDILKLFSDRSRYIDQLDKDIQKENECIKQIEIDHNRIKQLFSVIKVLGNYPEHDGLIPLTKLLYMKGSIKHTGEYHVHKAAHPNPFVFMKTLNQISEDFDNAIALKEKDIEKAKYSLYQLQERKDILCGHSNEDGLSLEDTDLPEEIISDKGIAVKVGNFYEIFEYENE